jgi:hypothetical protein
MACGCNKNKGALPSRNINNFSTRNVVSSRGSVVGNQPQPQPQQSVAPQVASIKTDPPKPEKATTVDPKIASMNLNIQKTSTSGMSKERLEIEKRRREAIRKALGK